MAKTKEEVPDRRSPGPKNRRTVIPSTFQISRPVSPMRQILDEAEGTATRPSTQTTPSTLSRPSNDEDSDIQKGSIDNNLQENTITPPRPSRDSNQSTPSTVSRASSPRSSSEAGILGVPRTSVAPSRDFMRVANSITREAVPGGLFAGKAKQLYDYLYSKTRGAMTPKMSVRLTKRELMRGADINTEVTLRSNLNRLRTIGLVETLEMRGVHGGNEYTIYIPDEIIPTTGSRPSRDSRPSISSQKIDGLEALESRETRGGVNLEIEEGLPAPNTLLKTTTDDDDGTGLLDFVRAIEGTALELVQGPLPVTEQERERWIECGKTLAEELHKIGMRTGTVSSVPALLNAHLRRCFGRQQQPLSPIKERVPISVEPKERLKRIIREIRGLHVGDSGYQREELIADVRYRVERAGLRVDDALIEEMVGPDPLDVNE